MASRTEVKYPGLLDLREIAHLQYPHMAQLADSQMSAATSLDYSS